MFNQRIFEYYFGLLFEETNKITLSRYQIYVFSVYVSRD